MVIIEPHQFFLPIFGCGALVLSTLLFSESAWAEPGLANNTSQFTAAKLMEPVQGQAQQEVIVRVRTVGASEIIPEGTADRDLAKIKFDVDYGLHDVEGKLHKLSFQKFRLLSTQEVRIPVMKKQMLFLTGGNTLALRPLVADDTRAKLWLRWADAAGTRILDTRINFVTGEPMLTGTEVNGNDGTVLVIDVKPLK